MSIEIAIRSELINDADVTALVGTRVYPVMMPQGFEMPCISYQRISSNRMHTLSGPTGRVDANFQVDFYDESYAVVRELADKARNLLDGFKGDLGINELITTENNEYITDINDELITTEQSIMGEIVGGIHLVSDRDLWQDNIAVYRVTHDYSVFYFD